MQCSSSSSSSSLLNTIKCRTRGERTGLSIANIFDITKSKHALSLLLVLSLVSKRRFLYCILHISSLTHKQRKRMREREREREEICKLLLLLLLSLAAVDGYYLLLIQMYNPIHHQLGISATSISCIISDALQCHSRTAAQSVNDERTKRPYVCQSQSSFCCLFGCLLGYTVIIMQYH